MAALETVEAVEPGTGEAPGDGLEEAVRRNLYRGSDSAPAAQMAVYVRRCDRDLAVQDWSELAHGRVTFPPPGEAAESASKPAAETD